MSSSRNLLSRNSVSQGEHPPLFSLGHCEVTPAATTALDAAGVAPSALFCRHGHGDWGHVPHWARQANGDAVRDGVCVHAIQSEYRLGGGQAVLVMTAPDRTRTSLLLSSEFQDRKVTSREGYAVWAATYDTVPNPLIAVEQPVVDRLLVGLPTIKTAADVGTGTGRLALALAQRGVRVVGFDPAPEMLRVARRAARAADLRGVRFIEASLGQPLPNRSERFDLLTCALALCHVPDLSPAVRECARLLKPGGHLLLTDFHPAAVAWGWRTAFIEPGVRYWLPNPGHSREDYLRSVRDAGCTLLDVQDIALGGEPYGESSPEALAERGAPPLCLTVLARKVPPFHAFDLSDADGRTEGEDE